MQEGIEDRVSTGRSFRMQESCNLRKEEPNAGLQQPTGKRRRRPRHL